MPVSDSPVDTPVLEVVSDSSKITDQAAFDTALESVEATTKQAVSAHRAATTVFCKAARLRMTLRSLIRRANGHPDWKAESDVYRLTVGKAEEAVWANVTADEKRRVDGAVRQHIARKYLESTIVDYVLRSMGTIPGLKWTEEKGDTPSYIASFDDKVPEQVKLRTAIAAEYVSSGLTLPLKFGGTKPGTGGGTTKGDPENPAGDFAAAIAGIDKMAPATAADDLLRAVSALSLKVRKGEKVQDRETVETTLVRMSVVAHMTAKVLGGKATEKDLETLTAALWVAAS